MTIISVLWSDEVKKRLGNEEVEKTVKTQFRAVCLFIVAVFHQNDNTMKLKVMDRLAFSPSSFHTSSCNRNIEAFHKSARHFCACRKLKIN